MPFINAANPNELFDHFVLLKLIAQLFNEFESSSLVTIIIIVIIINTINIMLVTIIIY